MNDSFEVKMIRCIRKNIIVILAVSLVCGAALAGFDAFRAKTSFAATTSLMIVDSEPEEVTAPYVSKEQSLVPFYAKLVTSSLVTDKVSGELNGKIPAKKLKTMVTCVPGTQYIDVTVKSDDEDTTLKLVNAFALSIKSVGAELRNADYIDIIDMPTEAVKVSSRSTAKFFVVGFLGAFILISLIFYAFRGGDKSADTKQDEK